MCIEFVCNENTKWKVVLLKEYVEDFLISNSSIADMKLIAIKNSN